MTRRRYTVLQWNMGIYFKQKLTDRVVRSRLDVLGALLAEHAPSIVALQEAPADLGHLRVFTSRYLLIQGPRGVATAILQPVWKVLYHESMKGWRALVVKADPPSRRELGLWIWNVHLPILHKSPESLRTLARCEPRDDLRRFRQRDPDRCELVIGDFNMPPHDDAMVRRDGFHANASHEWASRTALRRGRSYRPLFNPTPSIRGLASPPYGSYFRDKDRDDAGPWSMPDQVLMSARLAIPGEPPVTLVDSAGGRRLCDPRHGKPDPQIGSDHLPLVTAFQA
ncbi:endonuclease/exonuclease/phosphatase family protein [Sorangium sp. So ce513]|uniref:endonuclease/exonuclease/phosphatase family protein n=1 Tax=Sorangium sp. So ce513 TaxID=3133315 RepID=UPI003F612445